MINTGNIEIQRCSDFKLKAVRWLDSLGNNKNPDTEYFRAVFVDENGTTYSCVSDPDNGVHSNTVVRGGRLYLVFQNHNLCPGKIMYKDFARFADSDFDDNHADVSGPLLRSGISIVDDKRNGAYSYPEFDIDIIQ